jgi:YVTN family beta-propeller protein
LRAFRHVLLFAAASAAVLPLAGSRLAAQDPHAGHTARTDSAAHALHGMRGQPSPPSFIPPHPGHAAAPHSDAAVRMLRAELTARASGGGVAVQDGEVLLRLRVTDPATGRPATGLSPSAWVDVRRGAAATPMAQCEQRIGALSESSMMIKHGQISLATPVEDLNGHYLAVLAREPAIAVIDPLKGFGRTRLLTAVPLPAPGAGWASTPDDRLLFVSIPDSGVVAVVDTHDWKLRTLIRTGAAPGRVATDPRGARAWVAVEGAEPGVTVIDAARLAVAARVRTGAGPHAIAFSGDGALALVASAGAGTLTVIDAATARVLSTVHTGDRPVDVAWSPLLRLAYVANQGDGTVAVVDPARGVVTERVTFAPGIGSIRFAPDAAGHAMHGDADAGPAPGGRLAFRSRARARWTCTTPSPGAPCAR